MLYSYTEVKFKGDRWYERSHVSATFLLFHTRIKTILKSRAPGVPLIRSHISQKNEEVNYIPCMRASRQLAPSIILCDHYDSLYYYAVLRSHKKLHSFGQMFLAAIEVLRNSIANCIDLTINFVLKNISCKFHSISSSLETFLQANDKKILCRKLL